MKMNIAVFAACFCPLACCAVVLPEPTPIGVVIGEL